MEVGTDMRFEFSEAALRVLGAIEGAGHEAWLVGGCMRDQLMGRPVNDVDIASSATWQEVAAACEALGMRVHETGTAHGTVTIVDGDEAFEVTSFRADSPTSSDARHPDSITFVSSIEEDLKRRDFTINAIAWHPERGILDPFDGMHDIEGATIRAIGTPQRRFREDALRILRACRFASQLGFWIDPETLHAMVASKSLLAKVSIERITHELDLLLLGDHVHDAIIDCIDVLEFVLPELVAMRGLEQRTVYHCYDVLEHTAWAVQFALPERTVRWAALCHDMGKPAAAFFDDEGTEHFYGHAKVSAKMAAGIMDRLLMSARFKADVCAIVLAHSDKIAAEPRPVKRALSRLGGDVGLFRKLLELKRADMLAHAPEYRHQASYMDAIEQTLAGVLDREEAFTLKQLAIDGTDVARALETSPGPVVGEALAIALEGVIEGFVENERDALLAYIKDAIE